MAGVERRFLYRWGSDIVSPLSDSSSRNPTETPFNASANRIPERWYPGRFDLFGASHQLFHFAVVAAVIAHYLGVLKAFEYHHGLRSGECVV